MPFHILDPIQDSRWDDLVSSHPKASVFHLKGWLKALAGTYGYRPFVLTSTPPGERLSDGIVFCEIKSWMTGRRLVSLPFSDHADPLLSQQGDTAELMEWVRKEANERKWKYVEMRPLSWQMDSSPALMASESYWFHTLNLEPSLEQIFRGLHKNCVQRRIRKAEREQLTYEKGNSEEIINDFYRLLMITRRRHQLPPQPRAWFRNLAACMGSSMAIRLVRKDGVPIATILTLSHRGTVVYKYGCSDEQYHHLAGMPFLFWKLIEESKAANAELIDFGRTDLDNEGLIEFKDRFGTSRRRLTYFRYPERVDEKGVLGSKLPGIRGLFSVLPNSLSSSIGRVLYRHIG
jgi:CelD/BcsL family acetyltransferase involved in cellulose biosynthesis